MPHTEPEKEILSLANRVLIPIHHDNGSAGFDACSDQLFKVGHGPGVARLYPGYRVVPARFVRIDRRRKANPVVGGVLDRLVSEPGQIAKDFDEFEPQRLRLDQQILKIAIELRLAADELHLAAAERAGLNHDRDVIISCENIAVAAIGRPESV